MKMRLPDVTLIAPTGSNVEKTVSAIETCCSNIEFGAVKLVAPELPKNSPDYIIFDKCDEMDTYRNYNNYVFLKLRNHVYTSHCLLIQYDSWIINPEQWRDEWLQYDYIGAPWAIMDNSYLAWSTRENVRVGNGGFSLRSKKLLDVPFNRNLVLTEEKGYYNEDGNICCYHRQSFLDAGIKFAPVLQAARFSYETPVPENFGLKTFGFHKNPPPYIGFQYDKY